MAIAITRFPQLQETGFLLVVLGFLLAMIMPMLLSMVVGAVALRLRAAYFAIVTIGVNQGFRYLIEGLKILNGSEGIIFTAQLNSILGRERASIVSTFWADFIVFILAILAALITPILKE